MLSTGFRSKGIPRALLIAALVALPAALAAADVLVLKDGRFVEGKEMSRTDEGVEVHFENGTVLVPTALVHDAVIEGEENAFVPETEEEREKAEKGLVPFEGEWVKPDERAERIEERLEERRERIEEMKKHSEWRDRYQEETKYFEFEYTVPKHVCEYYQELMDEYFEVFAKTWKVRPDKDDPKLLVCFYTDLEKFHRTSGAKGGVRGYFRFVPPRELDFYYDRLDPTYTEEVMFHETNHYLQQLIDIDFSMPHFPGESLAEFYGASRFDQRRGKIETGLIHEGRLTEVETDVAGGEMMPLEKLVKTDGMYEHYTWGWTLVHFLMNHRKYDDKFQAFVIGLAKDPKVDRKSMGFGSLKTVEGDEVWETFRRYLGLRDEEDVAELEEEWHEYVKEKLEFVTARGKEKAAQAALGTGRRIRAKRLFREAIEAGTTNPLTFNKFAELLLNEGEEAEAAEHARRAVALDPLVGEYWFTLGRALRRQGETEEGNRMLRLAVEIDPDDFWMAYRAEQLLEDG